MLFATLVLGGTIYLYEYPLVRKPRVSVVVPQLNEMGNLRELHRRRTDTLRQADVDHEIILVDGGSTDGSWDVIEELSRPDARVIGLRFASLLGLAATVGAILMTIIIVLQKLIWGIAIDGYALLASGLFLVGGMQMLLLGVVGEYIARIYRQVQARPLYVIDQAIGGSSGPASVPRDVSR